ncbi:50S ribosomal protein L29 [Candidatus Jorgensenbacteria bacterium]|nr:50S ribosomal protein L29 [Candidatus Jorgensenbacteria bacterium]
MKKNELQTQRSKPLTEIDREIFDYRERLARLGLDLVQGKVKNIREIRHLKKNIAQLLTLKKSKLAGNSVS